MLGRVTSEGEGRADDRGRRILLDNALEVKKADYGFRSQKTELYDFVTPTALKKSCVGCGGGGSQRSCATRRV